MAVVPLRKSRREGNMVLLSGTPAPGFRRNKVSLESETKLLWLVFPVGRDNRGFYSTILRCLLPMYFTDVFLQYLRHTTVRVPLPGELGNLASSHRGSYRIVRPPGFKGPYFRKNSAIFLEHRRQITPTA